MPLRISLVATLALALQAQQPEDGATTRSTTRSAGELLSGQLSAAASIAGADFTAEWRWPRSIAGQVAQGGAVARVVVAGPGGDPDEVERASGRFRGDVFAVLLERDEPVEVVQAGRHAVVRLGDGPWQLSWPQRDGRFVPDPQLILRALANFELDVLDRSIGERDGSAVEQVAVTLTDEQVTALVAAGAMEMPNPLMRNIQRFVETGRIRPADVPLSVVDVAVEFDVETRRLSRLRVRALGEPVDVRNLMQLAGLPGVRGANAEAGDDDKNGERRELPAPTAFEGGLPVRATEGLEERTFELRLTHHGATEPIELDEVQRRLLGR